MQRTNELTFLLPLGSGGVGMLSPQHCSGLFWFSSAFTQHGLGNGPKGSQVPQPLHHRSCWQGNSASC